MTRLASILGAQFSLEHSLLLAGVLLIIMSLMLGIRKKRRRIRQRGSARDQLERLKEQTAVRGDLEQIMVEIDQLARQMGAQLDAKSIALEKLIRNAEQTIARLEQLHHVAADRPALPAGDPQTTRVYQLADEGLSAIEIAQKLDEHVGKVELILSLRNVGA